eukprot:3771282-Ditylum_brightwellii.AAC.1
MPGTFRLEAEFCELPSLAHKILGLESRHLWQNRAETVDYTPVLLVGKQWVGHWVDCRGCWRVFPRSLINFFRGK